MKVTFLQFPGVYVGLTEVSDPASIKLFVRLHFAMRVTSGGQRSWKTRERQILFLKVYGNMAFKLKIIESVTSVTKDRAGYL